MDYSVLSKPRLCPHSLHFPKNPVRNNAYTRSQNLVRQGLRSRLPAFRSKPSLPLFALTLAIAGIAMALPYIGPAARIFSFVPLAPGVMAMLLLIVMGYLLANEITKLWYYRKKR